MRVPGRPRSFASGSVYASSIFVLHLPLRRSVSIYGLSPSPGTLRCLTSFLFLPRNLVFSYFPFYRRQPFGPPNFLRLCVVFPFDLLPRQPCFIGSSPVSAPCVFPSPVLFISCIRHCASRGIFHCFDFLHTQDVGRRSHTERNGASPFSTPPLPIFPPLSLGQHLRLLEAAHVNLLWGEYPGSRSRLRFLSFVLPSLSSFSFSRRCRSRDVRMCLCFSASAGNNLRLSPNPRRLSVLLTTSAL